MLDNLAFLKKEASGRRIASVDYGKKRLGYAVCDEFHISISPKKVFNPSLVVEMRNFMILDNNPSFLNLFSFNRTILSFINSSSS